MRVKKESTDVGKNGTFSGMARWCRHVRTRITISGSLWGISFASGRRPPAARNASL
jgi:hypothetical protein